MHERIHLKFYRLRNLANYPPPPLAFNPVNRIRAIQWPGCLEVSVGRQDMRAWVGQDEYVSGRFHANLALFNQLPLHLVHGDYQTYQNLESVISVLLSLQRLFLDFKLNILFINMSGSQGLKSTSYNEVEKQDTSRRI